jgi:oligopeptide/dipeptide ABC transporter ATP-binding protein
MEPLLEVTNLVTEFRTRSGTARAVDEVSFSVRDGEFFGIVGESGCGKSATCRSILRLFGGSNGQVTGGSIRFRGEDLVRMTDAQLTRIRGRDISFIFQDPLAALNPTMRVGDQITEVILQHRNCSRSEANAQALRLLADVQVTSPERRLRSYPHELSGGLRQRVMIAMALALSPQLIIADEPTTALDVTVQDQILRLLIDRRDALGAAIILVTHDLGVVAEVCDRIAVMYGGRIVETGPTHELLVRPRHPYTRALVDALPSRGVSGAKLRSIAGAPPNLTNPPPGCRFEPRCGFALPACRAVAPPLRARALTGAGRLDACIREDIEA